MDSILYERSATLPSTNGHFYRPRIERLLVEALEYPIVTVIAGTGWGKTQAVSAFLCQTDTNYIWSRLSKLDNYPTHFWESFIYSIGTHNPVFYDVLSLTGFPGTIALFQEFLNSWAKITKDFNKIVLVFDDFHLISEPAIIRFIENLLNARLLNLSIIIIGRALPDLDLHGIYTDNSIFKITEDDLRFTRNEIEDYFDSLSLSLSGDNITNIYKKTEGWISAIYLIGLSLKKDLYNALAIAENQIFELIEREIFSGYSKESQNTLIKLACYGDIPVEIVKEYAKNNLDLLDEIDKNFFIRLNPVTKKYEIHNLFLEFLLEKQIYLSEEEHNDTHYKAAEWYVAHGLSIDAINHYQLCGQHEKIWDIISHYEVAISQDLADLFIDLIERFPEEFFRRNGLISVVHARLLLNNGRVAESSREFMSIIGDIEALPPTAENKAVVGEAYLFMGMISLLSCDYQFVEYYKKAYECLPNGSVLIDNRLSFCDGNFMVLVAEPVPGEVKRFLDAVMEAMPYGVKAMNGAAYGVKYVTKSEAEYYTCNMKEAESSAYKAIYQAEQNAQYDTVCAAYFVLIRVYFSSGNYLKAAACVEELHEKLEGPHKSAQVNNCIFTRDIMRSWYYSRLGVMEEIPAWILKKDKREQFISANNSGRDQFMRADCLLKDENYTELAALLTALEDYYEQNRLLLARLGVQVYKSIAAHKTGDITQSMVSLRKAYDLAVGNELYMQFIEMGKYMRAVIYTAKRSDKNTVPDEWLDEIYTKAMTYEKQINHVNMQYALATGAATESAVKLTPRENEILRCLCQGMTGKEIAAGLFISTSTVKKKLSSIYNKLGAANRAEAIGIATQLGLDKQS